MEESLMIILKMQRTPLVKLQKKKSQEWKEESAWTEYYDKSRIAGDAIHHTLNYLEELKKQKGR